MSLEELIHLLRPIRLQDRKGEEGSYARPYYIGVIEVGHPLTEDKEIHPRSIGGSHDRAEVAGLFDPLAYDQKGGWREGTGNIPKESVPPHPEGDQAIGAIAVGNPFHKRWGDLNEGRTGLAGFL
jgi:hypothetical protein